MTTSEAAKRGIIIPKLENFKLHISFTLYFFWTVLF